MLSPCIAAEQAQKLRPKPTATAPPPESPPADTAELIGRLARPGAPSHWVQLAAEDLARHFGARKDRSLFGEFLKIMQAVWRGLVKPDDVIDALRQAMAPDIDKPGAIFWRAFKRNTGLDEHDLRDLGHREAS
jgi:hypothetical protein